MAKRKKFVTPAGVAVYPRLNRPDTKYNEHGTYSADLRIPIEEAKELLKDLGAIYKAHTGQTHPKFAPRKDKEAVWYFDQDEEGDFEKDHVILKLRAKNLITKSGDLWDRKPKLFDAVGKPIKNPPQIGGGTIMKVSFEADCYSGKVTGVRLIPQAVQIIDLVEYESGGSAGDFGFGQEEGFTSSSDFDEDSNDFAENNNNNDEDDNADAQEDEGDFY